MIPWFAPPVPVCCSNKSRDIDFSLVVSDSLCPAAACLPHMSSQLDPSVGIGSTCPWAFEDRLAGKAPILVYRAF